MVVANVFSAILLFGMQAARNGYSLYLAMLLLFGGKKIPELMKGIGKGMREFKDAKENVKSEIEEGMKEKDKDRTKGAKAATPAKTGAGIT
jgi:sec-independent protein translocase protein TatA